MQAGSMSLAGTRCEARRGAGGGGAQRKMLSPVSNSSSSIHVETKYLHCFLSLLGSWGEYTDASILPICKLLLWAK